MVAAQDDAHLVHRGDDLGLAPHLDVDAARVDPTDEHLRRDRQRDEDLVVEVLAELPAWLQHADDLELVTADAHGLADRVAAGEEALRRLHADDHDAAAEAHVGRGDRSSAYDSPVVDGRERRGHADDVAARLVAAGRDHRALDVLVRRHCACGGQLRAAASASRHHAIGGALRRTDVDELSVRAHEVRPEKSDALGDAGLRAGADRRDGNQRADADDDAERRQQRAKPVRAQRPERDQELLDHAVTRSSATMRPSATCRILPACVPTSCECVTNTDRRAGRARRARLWRPSRGCRSARRRARRSGW